MCTGVGSSRADEALKDALSLCLLAPAVGSVVREPKQVLACERLRELLEERLELVTEEGRAAVHRVNQNHLQVGHVAPEAGA